MVATPMKMRATAAVFKPPATTNGGDSAYAGNRSCPRECGDPAPSGHAALDRGGGAIIKIHRAQQRRAGRRGHRGRGRGPGRARSTPSLLPGDNIALPTTGNTSMGPSAAVAASGCIGDVFAERCAENNDARIATALVSSPEADDNDEDFVGDGCGDDEEHYPTRAAPACSPLSCPSSSAEGGRTHDGGSGDGDDGDSVPIISRRTSSSSSPPPSPPPALSPPPSLAAAVTVMAAAAAADAKPMLDGESKTTPQTALADAVGCNLPMDAPATVDASTAKTAATQHQYQHQHQQQQLPYYPFAPPPPPHQQHRRYATPPSSAHPFYAYASLFAPPRYVGNMVPMPMPFPVPLGAPHLSHYYEPPVSFAYGASHFVASPYHCASSYGIDAALARAGDGGAAAAAAGGVVLHSGVSIATPGGVPGALPPSPSFDTAPMHHHQQQQHNHHHQYHQQHQRQRQHQHQHQQQHHSAAALALSQPPHTPHTHSLVLSPTDLLPTSSLGHPHAGWGGAQQPLLVHATVVTPGTASPSGLGVGIRGTFPHHHSPPHVLRRGAVGVSHGLPHHPSQPPPPTSPLHMAVTATSGTRDDVNRSGRGAASPEPNITATEATTPTALEEAQCAAQFLMAVPPPPASGAAAVAAIAVSSAMAAVAAPGASLRVRGGSKGSRTRGGAGRRAASRSSGAVLSAAASPPDGERGDAGGGHDEGGGRDAGGGDAGGGGGAVGGSVAFVAGLADVRDGVDALSRAPSQLFPRRCQRVGN